MPDRMVWVGQESIAGTVRTWHLVDVPGETLCGLSTQAMKALPKAAWKQVLNPCTHCQLKADLPVAMYESPRELGDNSDVAQPEHRELPVVVSEYGREFDDKREVTHPEPGTGRHARQD